MRISRRPAAALAGTAALVAGVALWPSVAGADSDGDPDYTVIEGEFTSVRLEEAYIDHAPAGLSAGDQTVYTNRGSGVLGDGTDYGSCTFHQVPADPTTGTVILACVQTSVGADGDSLTFQGTFPFDLAAGQLAEPVEWAVTGGTGESAKARGDITVETGALVDDNVEDDVPGVFTSTGTVRIIVAP